MSRAILIVSLCGFVSQARAAELHVPGQYPAIQEAIDVARDGDVVIVQPGTYHESLRFRGKGITVRSSDPNSWQIVRKTAIAGWQTKTSCVVFDQGESNASILDGFTLWAAWYGSAVQTDTGSFGDAGGGVLCVNSSPTIRHCWIDGNVARYGGGIALFGACRARVVNCLITHNSAGDVGGAILVRREIARPVEGSATDLQHYQDAADTTVSAADKPLIGTPVPHDGPMIINCTIVDNASWGYGTGEPDTYDVDCWDANPFILNTIIYGSRPSLLISDLSAVSHCCLGETHLFQGDYKSSAAIVDIALMANSFSGFPGFIKVPDDPIDEGGYGTEYHLAASSPCVNAGSPAALEYVRHDIDGQPRVMGAQIDIGADEVRPELAVTRPQHDDVWAAAGTQAIRWIGDLHRGSVDLLFSDDGGGHWSPIAQDQPNTGDYLWEVPEAIDSNACVVSVVPHTPDANVLQVDSGRFTIHPDLRGPEVESKWSSLGGNLARSGLSEFRGPDYGRFRWSFETGGAAVASVTIGFDRRVHVACEDGKLYTLEADGGLLWTYTMDSPAFSSPAIGSDGSLFVGTEDGTLYAIDLSGKLRWTYRTGGAIYSSPAVAPNGDVYAGSTDGTLYALANDGSELWRFRTKGPGLRREGAVFASPTIGTDGSVYIAGVYDPNLYALDPDDGSVKWVCRFGGTSRQSRPAGRPFASPVVAEDGTIYQVLLHDPHLYAIEPEHGAILWSTDLTDPCSIAWPAQGLKRSGDGWSEPALGPDGTIYVSTNDPCLRAVDPSGSIKWVTPLGEVGAFTLTVDKRGYVYAASEDGLVYVVRPDGVENSYLLTGGRPTFPVLAGDNVLVVPDSTDYSLLVTDVKNTVLAISSKSMESQL